MTSTDFDTSRIRMLDCQVRPSGIDDSSILDAFASVAKEHFVPIAQRDLTYSDDTIALSTDPIRYILPCASLARLYQLAVLSPSDRVLDVGCTTGYSSAILSYLCADVTAIESDSDLAHEARRSLSSYDNVRVIECSLPDGCVSHAPYDAIFLGGYIDHLPSSLISQLSSCGRIISVHGEGNSGIAMVHSVSSGKLVSESHFSLSLPLLPSFESVSEFVF